MAGVLVVVVIRLVDPSTFNEGRQIFPKGIILKCDVRVGQKGIHRFIKMRPDGVGVVGGYTVVVAAVAGISVARVFIPLLVLHYWCGCCCHCTSMVGVPLLLLLSLALAWRGRSLFPLLLLLVSVSFGHQQIPSLGLGG